MLFRKITAVDEVADRLYGKEPWSPPIVETRGGVAHLLCWELHDRDHSWWAWISWVQSTGDPVRHRHHVVAVPASSVRPIEPPAAYEHVPRRVFGADGRIRPWTLRQ
jgi:hypothetical protein